MPKASTTKTDRADLAPDRAAWEQQPEESDKWYGRFEMYRNLGTERTLLGAWRRATGKERAQADGYWQRQCSRWRWRDRARAWDKHLRNLARQEQEQAVIEMGRRAARNAATLQGVLMLPAEALDELVRVDRAGLLATLAALPTEELVKLTQRSAAAVQMAVRTEMLARGEATDRIEQHAEMEVTSRADVRATLAPLVGNPKAHDLARQLALMSLARISGSGTNGSGNGAA